jgi:hypothetical protein
VCWSVPIMLQSIALIFLAGRQQGSRTQIKREE